VADQADPARTRCATLQARYWLRLVAWLLSRALLYALLQPLVSPSRRAPDEEERAQDTWRSALSLKQVSNVRCGLYTSSGSTERFLQTQIGNGDRRAAGAILRHETEEKVRPPVSGRAVLLTLQIGRTRFRIIIPTPFSSRSADHDWLYASEALERYAAASLPNANMHPFAAYYEHHL
jgi:hypothetical protein